mmetsp:Transcript_20986/g.45628  ORF Transcript_20986/g.45628 Transcript_20986/m.45628 type:complete len:389 (+) Transcript_20986:118-1284(+)
MCRLTDKNGHEATPTTEKLPSSPPPTLSSLSSSTNDKGGNSSSPSLLTLLRLPICATGICVSYLCYGYFQERLFSDPNERLGPSFVLVTSCITNVFVALIWKNLQQRHQDDTASTQQQTEDTTKPAILHHKLLVATAFCYVAAMTSSNEAIPLVSYPVAVLAKSCKLIPIMIVGQFVERKLYSWTEWTAALLISSGICLFHFSRMAAASSDDHSNNATTKDETTYGMGLLLLSLLLDGLLSSCQNLLKRAKALPHEHFTYRQPNAVETMLYVNLYALLFLVPWTHYNGQLTDVGRLWDSATKLLILNGAVGCGQVFIFLTVTWYSSIMTTTITTTRKFFTILLSVHSFGHVFTSVQWVSVALVFCGLYLSIIQQQRSKSVKDHMAKQD